MSANGEGSDKKTESKGRKKEPEADYEDVDVCVKKQPASQIPVKLNHRSRARRSIERESASIRNDNKFKSILKKPSATFNDTDTAGSVAESAVKTPGTKSGSHFYLPMPNASRKKVQFLVENELANSQPTDNAKQEEPDKTQELVKAECLTNGKDDESESLVSDDEGES